MIRHHPEDEWLVALAAGRADGGQGLLLAVHLETCATCRARLHTLQAVGGDLLAAIEPAPMAATALDATLARLDAPASALAATASPVAVPVSPIAAPASPRAARPVAAAVSPPDRPPLADGVEWPASLRHCGISRWHWMGPGMRWSRVTLPYASPGALFLLKIPPGRSLPSHTHRGIELTQVLCGSFHDGRSLFGPGDFDATDEDVHHQPVVRPGEICVCLAYVGGRLAFDGWAASAIGRSIGM